MNAGAGAPAPKTEAGEMAEAARSLSAAVADLTKAAKELTRAFYVLSNAVKGPRT